MAHEDVLMRTGRDGIVRQASSQFAAGQLLGCTRDGAAPQAVAKSKAKSEAKAQAKKGRKPKERTVGD